MFLTIICLGIVVVKKQSYLLISYLVLFRARYQPRLCEGKIINSEHMNTHLQEFKSNRIEVVNVYN